MLERTVRFCVVAETLSIKRAAERLRVDQSWLSRQIQQLEAELGFTLFKRTTRSIVLTPQGEAFLPVAMALAAAADVVKKRARELSQEMRQELRIGVGQFSYWMAARDKLFEALRADPKLKVQTHVGSSVALAEMVVSGELDVAIVVLPAIQRLDYACLSVIEPLLLVPREHPLASAPQIAMADLRGVTLAMPRKDNSRPFRLQYQPFLDAGVTPRWVTAGSSRAAVHHAAVERICCLGYPDEILATGHLVRRSIIDSTSIVEFGVIRRAGDDRQAVRRFWAGAQEVAEQVGRVEEVDASMIRKRAAEAFRTRSA